MLTLVNPYEELRSELKKNNKGQVLEIMLTSSRDLRKEYHVEDFETGNPRFALNTDRNVDDTWESLAVMIEGKMANTQWNQK